MMNIRICLMCTRYFDSLNHSECCGMSYRPPGINELSMWGRLMQQGKDDFKKEHGYYPDFPPPKQYVLSKRIRRLVLDRDGRKCTKCTATKNLHIHHKVHRKNGGEDEVDNLITLCDSCHAAEHEGEAIHNAMLKRLVIA